MDGTFVRAGDAAVTSAGNAAQEAKDTGVNDVEIIHGDSSEDDGFDEEEEEETVCAVCQLNHGDAEILMCDCCDREYHGACVAALTVGTSAFETYGEKDVWMCPICFLHAFMPVDGEELGK